MCLPHCAPIPLLGPHSADIQTSGNDTINFEPNQNCFMVRSAKRGPVSVSVQDHICISDRTEVFVMIYGFLRSS